MRRTLIGTVLFLLLTPGFLLNIPPDITSNHGALINLRLGFHKLVTVVHACLFACICFIIPEIPMPLIMIFLQPDFIVRIPAHQEDPYYPAVHKPRLSSLMNTTFGTHLAIFVISCVFWDIV